MTGNYIATYIQDITGGTLYSVDDFLAMLGADGADGADGTDGLDGEAGADGVGVPAGGTTHQQLRKIDGTDYNTEWFTLFIADISDVTVTDDYVAVTKGFRPGLDDDLSPADVGYLFESTNDGHLYWVHRDGNVHLLCSSGGYGASSTPNPYSPGLLADKYFSSYGSATPTTLVVTAGRQYFVPFYVPHTAEVAAIAVAVTALVASSAVRLGIYSNDNGTPGTLLLDAGAVATTAVANSPILFTEVLPAGWYWLSSIFSHAVTVVAEPFPGDSRLHLSSMYASTTHYCYTTQAYGALPSAPVGTKSWPNSETDAICPRIGIGFV